MSENNGGNEPNKNNDNNNAPNGPSIQNKLIWLIIIFVPIALIMFGNTNSTNDDSILSQSKLN